MSNDGSLKQRFGRRNVSKNLPVEYIQGHMEGDDFNTAMISPRLEYVAKINRFATSGKSKELESEEESLFSGAQEELQLLKDAVVQYQQKTGQDPSLMIRIGDEMSSPWKGVKEAVKVAREREDDQDNDSWSARNSCNKIIDNISTFETWLDLLPGGDYGAVVGGVFRMIVTAAKRAHDVRVIILQALADIPYWVGRANRYRELYEKSKPRELVQMTAQLCSTVLIALRHIMIYFTEGILKKMWKSMAQGQAYKQTLLMHIDRVKDLVAKTDQEAAVSLQYRMRDLEKLSNEYFPAITRQLNELREQQNNRTLRLDETMTENLTARIGEATAGYFINSFYTHLSSNPGIDRIRNLVPPQLLDAGLSTELEQRKEPTMSIDTIISALDLSPDVPQHDLKRCLSMGSALSLIDQDRIKWTIESSRLRDWLNFPKSHTLLINGNGDANEMFSLTTFLSAKLLESLGHIEPIITQHFFCSLHTSSRKDNMADATGLIKSLSFQLLRRDLPWDLSFLSSTDLENIRRHDLDTSCTLFRGLMQQIPDTTFLFWMIDGINYYERSERRSSFVKVIGELQKTIQDCSGVIIKLLLTCPSVSFFVKDKLDKDEILNVPFIVDGGRQGLSELAFQKSLGNDIEKLDGADPGDQV